MPKMGPSKDGGRILSIQEEHVLKCGQCLLVPFQLNERFGMRFIGLGKGKIVLDRLIKGSNGFLNALFCDLLPTSRVLLVGVETYACFSRRNAQRTMVSAQ